ncbi:serine/threonine protein kinase [Streptomyces sp. WM6386]|uniref:serine/threonine protein kinase n=1 Tax=Streptomyces sp. WM6386 TaxID=1415558 RepID=UPI000695DA79|nr:protein kinase [Streptomyces sp. WM6386]
MLNEVLADRFQITGELGSGGMGRVWAAVDMRMRRNVAVKVMHPQHPADEAGARARFEREVQLAARLNHQNIVTFHDWGEVSVGGNQTLYIVMERVDGIALDKRLAEPTPLPWSHAVGWAAQIAHALHAAHDRGVVHRDIKPGNAVLTDDGTVKVLDFGVAKFLGDTIGARKLTAGTMLGSVEYMSPEQIDAAETIDGRSDLYSLGCFLYHAVTGTPPFGGSQASIVHRHKYEAPVPLSKHVEGLPPALDDLVIRLLEKCPEDRPVNATVVREALVAILFDHDMASPYGDTMDVAQLGHGASLSGLLLRTARMKAHRLVEDADKNAARRQASLEGDLERRRQAVDAQLREVAATAKRTSDQAHRLLDESRSHAEQTLHGARVEAERITEQARGDAARAKKVGDARNAHLSRTAKEDADKQLADAKAESARIVEEAGEKARRIEAAAYRRTVADWHDHPLRQRLLGWRAIPHLDGSARAPGVGATPLSPSVSFRETRRGYERAPVNEFIGKLEERRNAAAVRLSVIEQQLVYLGATNGQSSPGLLVLERELALRRIAAAKTWTDLKHLSLATPMPCPAPSDPFQVVKEGYDSEQVDQRIQQLAEECEYLWALVATLEELLKYTPPEPSSG